MPIKNLTERRRLPRIGKIHLGIKVKTKEGAEYPKAVDYFVFDPNHPQYDELVATFGEQPKELRVLFPVDDLEAVASQYYRLYSRSRGLVCKGDGETCDRLIDTDTGGLANRDTKNVTRKEMPCQGRECADYGRRGCGEVMNLQFIIPEVSGFGVWQIDTGSINSIINVNNALDLVKQVYGRISMVPLILALEPKEVTNPDDGRKKTVRVLNIRSMDKMIEAMHKSNLAPLALVDAMFEQEGFTPDEELDLPEVGDTAPFIDLPSVTEGPPEPTASPAPGIKEPHPQTAPVDEDWEKLGRDKSLKTNRDPQTIHSLTDMMKACHDDFLMQPKAVLAELGVVNQSELTETPTECYLRIAAVRNKEE